MNLQLEDFEGPFDLLLHLIKKSEMDIYKVNISEIIDQYINFINSVDRSNIDLSSEYLVLSSELIHLKSRKLVNKMNEEDNNISDDEYSIESEEDLRNKLIEYERYKNISDAFRSLEENRMDYYTKLPENISEYIEDDKVVNSEVSVEELINAFLSMQQRVNFLKPVTTKITRKEYSIKEKIKEIRNILNIKKIVDFTELFDIITKDTVVVTFLSLLSMSKNNEIIIKQDRAFSNITIEKK